MLKIENVRFEHNRMLITLSDGREEVRHLLNWPLLFPIPRKELEQYEILLDRIIWPLLKFELTVAQILKAKKR